MELWFLYIFKVQIILHLWRERSRNSGNKLGPQTWVYPQTWIYMHIYISYTYVHLKIDFEDRNKGVNSSKGNRVTDTWILPCFPPLYPDNWENWRNLLQALSNHALSKECSRSHPEVHPNLFFSVLFSYDYNGYYFFEYPRCISYILEMRFSVLCEFLLDHIVFLMVFRREVGTLSSVVPF